MSTVIAVDGPAAAGKGTIARALAREFGLRHLDTGLLYRAVGRRVLAGEDPVEAARSLTEADLDGDELRSAAVAEAASRVAAIPAVREALVETQRAFAATPPGAVIDGRDIGTVICPDADVKLFVTASPETRARRRWLELQQRGERLDYDTVLADVLARDERDRTRATSPLRPAPDAHLLDTTNLSIDAAVAEAVAIARQTIGQGRD